MYRADAIYRRMKYVQAPEQSIRMLFYSPGMPTISLHGVSLLGSMYMTYTEVRAMINPDHYKADTVSTISRSNPQRPSRKFRYEPSKTTHLF